MRLFRIGWLWVGIVAHLTACAAALPRGEADSIAWEVINARQSTEEHGSRMRWNFTILLRNHGASVITFEQLDVGTRAMYSGNIRGGIQSQPYSRRLEPNQEVRLSRSESWTCDRCAPEEANRFFRQGFVQTITFTGRDAQGATVKVPVQVPLNSSFGIP
jgi:hypothetical protein